ncbi:hypothetical protein VK792_12525 [Mesobacterium sp. TK19101]|uniref:Uncharacterized protein n=1 Tax=Mesobacterium hydrothermale TaxID=3111907 RepID=A0ABU6HIF1_9RHOB|nr:hypothetical protein [Mesobacterium sp. TK19101]MEC3862111.1 hypothetical protein [Mesobacterium sp. TK19101]
MTWHDIVANWSQVVRRLHKRFPQIDSDVLDEPPLLPQHLTQHLAERHDLTLLEADEELRDWMFVEDLARQAQDMRAG